MILEYPTLEKAAAAAECVLRRLANVPQYTTHPVCGRVPSVRTLGEVRSEIGILIACAIPLAEIKAGALIELALMVNSDEPLNKESTLAMDQLNHFQRKFQMGIMRVQSFFYN